MMKIAVLALLVAAVSGGIVTPVDRCGGEGVPLQLRITNCEGAPPCTIIPGDVYEIEGDFIASASSSEAKFRLTARTPLGEIVVSDGSIGAIFAGTNYTATQAITISSALSGQTVTARVEIYHAASNALEICVEAGMSVQ